MQKGQHGQSRLFDSARTERAMCDKDSVLSYKTDIFPAYDYILSPAEKAEKALSAVYDHGDDPCRFGIYLNIVGKAYAAAVCTVDDLLVPELCKTTVIHKLSPPTYSIAGGDIL